MSTTTSSDDRWLTHAACRDFVVDFDATFDDTRSRAGSAHRSARQVCHECPVQRACLDDALVSEESGGPRYGMRGGLLPGERTRLARLSA